MSYKPNAADKADIAAALDKIKSTDVYLYCESDYDFNITRGVGAIEAFLAGDWWQT